MNKLFNSTLLLTLCVSTGTLAHEIAPLESALTLAQTKSDQGQLHSMLILEDNGSSVTAVNLSQHFSDFPDDSLTLVRDKGYQTLVEVADNLPRITVDYSDLQPAGGLNSKQIAAGANYKEHGVEANIDEVFLFPKYATPTPSHSKIAYREEVLLDYEVELCMRWSDKLVSEKGLQRHFTGLFLCGDFSDRAGLLRNLDVDNITSGHGFTDSKSGEGYFPTGPYLVVPKNWQTFLSSITISSHVNGQIRQQEQASKMIKKPEELVKWILNEGALPLWKYHDQDIPMLDQPAIAAGQSLLTGTPEGVIYDAPSLSYMVMKSLKWLATLSFLDSGPVDYLFEEYIAESKQENRYLQVGDSIRLEGSYLGAIQVDIVKGR